MMGGLQPMVRTGAAEPESASQRIADDGGARQRPAERPESRKHQRRLGNVNSMLAESRPKISVTLTNVQAASARLSAAAG